MDVIANNIANVNTEGFKAQRALFTDALYQNLQGATMPDDRFGRTGINPMQVGLGLNLASIDNLMHQGIARRTDQPLDVAIEGRGFLIVRDRGTNENLFTRAGNIRRDSQWNLHINGNALMGWSTVPCADTAGGHAVNRGMLRPLSFQGEKQNMPAEPTTRIDILGNMNINYLSRDHATGMDYLVRPKRFFDSLGNEYETMVRFTFHRHFDDGSSAAANSPHGYWVMEFNEMNADGGVVAYLDGNRRNPVSLAMCFFGAVDAPRVGDYIDANDPTFLDSMHTSATLSFDSNGNLIGMGRTTQGRMGPLAPGVTAGSPDDLRPEGTIPYAFLPGATITGGTDPRWTRGTRFDMMVIPHEDVAPSATFGDTGLRPNATTGQMERPFSRYATGAGGTNIPIGAITLDFSRLMQMGEMMTTLGVETINGGGPGELDDISVGRDGIITGRFTNGRQRILGQIPLAFFANPEGLDRVGNSMWRESANSGRFDGTGQVGRMIGGALEGSNVDLGEEFTNMIVTQRGFQAASRTITVSDEMLQELVNLRR